MSRLDKGSVTKGPAYFPAGPLTELAKGLRTIASGFLKGSDTAEQLDELCRDWLRERCQLDG